MKHLTLLLAILLCFAVPSLAAETTFYFDARPIAFLSSPHADEFTASKISKPTQQENMDANANFLPNLKMGLGIGGPEGVVNLGFGGGYLRNNALTSTFASFDVSPRLKLSDRVAVGPHLAYLIFASPEWDGSAQLDISGNRGFMSGFALNFGKKAGFTLSFDYIDAVFDVKSHQSSDWQVNREKINMSGMSVQMGISGNF